MSEIAKELLEFIEKSPSCYHAVKQITSALDAGGYEYLPEHAEWNIKAGGSYYTQRNLSSVIAFRIPEGKLPMGYMIAAAHSDSPSFKIKETPDAEAASKYTRINVEKYGGMLCSTWFDKPLSSAGKVTVMKDGRIESRLVNIDRDLFIIPSVAIHMNRSANETAACNPASDMQPIAGSSAVKGGYKKLLAAECGCAEEDILSYDMFLYNRTPGSVWGIENEFVSSRCLDDLQCVFAAMKGFLAAPVSTSVPVLCICDNEEVGSTTKQGAASTFLSDVLTRINESLGGTHSDYVRSLSLSLMVSADNAHAVHPNHPEYADPCNRPYMNEGIVIKYNANQRYTTDSVSDALFTAICNKAGVPVQHYTNRPDIPGGGTLGNISNTQVSLNTVDIGLPQLAMHSAYETAGVKDTGYLVTAMKEFFGSSIKKSGEESYTIE